MKDNLISIGKMAMMNHISVPTLRLYDEMDLLKPRFVDRESGYRYYSIEQNARLDMIAYMKGLGMSLKEIKRILETGDITLIEKLLIDKMEQIHATIRSLKIQHDAVERSIASIERYRRSPNTGTIALEYIDRRYLYGIKCIENFYDKNIASYEKSLSALRDDLLAKGLRQIHSYNTGTSIKEEDFINERFIADKVFIFADRYLRDSGFSVSVIESGMYACIYIDSYDYEIESAFILRRYCIENDYKIAGDYICEVLTEFNVFDNKQRGMFLRLQVPLSFSK